PDIYERRTNYLWKWVQCAFQITSLKLADETMHTSNVLKCHSAFLTILLDDICDNARSEVIFERAVQAMQGELPDDDSDLYDMIRDVWRMVQQELQATPNYRLLKPYLEAAYGQWLDSFRYSLHLALDNGAANQTPFAQAYATAPGYLVAARAAADWQRYLHVIPHTIHVYLSGLIDLLFVPGLQPEHIKPLTQIFLLTQQMSQIGNWVTTWERELPHGDFSSGLVIYALARGWVQLEDLAARADVARLAAALRACPARDDLLKLWSDARAQAAALAEATRLPALAGYVDRFSTILHMQLASEGLT
nr:hypothetical protein [Chloroflexaceae bacterium]